MKLYVYGIIDSNGQIVDPICGLEGVWVHSISYRDLGVVVSEVSRPIQSVTNQVVLRHEEVVEKLMARFTVLPVRFLTVVDRKDNVLSLMRRYYDDFRDNLERLRNKVEFGIKVIWPGAKIRGRLVDAFKKKTLDMPVLHNSPKGRYIREKYAEYKAGAEFDEKARRFIRVIDIFVSKFAAEKKLAKLKTEDLLLDAVYLVEKSKQNDFKEAFDHIRTAHPGLEYLFSGPRPLYDFIFVSRRSDVPRELEQGEIFGKAIRGHSLAGVQSI